MNRAKITASILLILGIIASVTAQSPQHTENKADHVLRGSGRVNPSTLGMEIQIPLGSYAGRGINVPITLNYSSKVWRTDYKLNMNYSTAANDYCVEKHEAIYGENSVAGWTTSLAVPYIEYTGQQNTFDPQGHPSGSEGCDTNPQNPGIVIIKRINIHLPGGESHELRDETGNAVGSFPANFDGTFRATDGSNIIFFQNSATGSYRLLMPDGSYYDFEPDHSGMGLAIVRKATKFTDRNGNFTTYHAPTAAYPNGYWTDTLGRTLSPPFTFSAPTDSNPQVYTLPGMTGSYKLYWKKLKDTTPEQSALTDFNQSLKYASDTYFGGGRMQRRESGTYLFSSDEFRWLNPSFTLFNPRVLAEIELPTGQRYKFTYDIYGRIERIYYPTGGEERFEYSVIPVLSNVDSPDINEQTNFGVTRRKVFQTAGQGTPYEWTYDAQYVAPNGYKITSTNPDNTKVERYLHRNAQLGESLFGFDSILAGMPYEERVYAGSGQIVSQKLTNWTVTQFQDRWSYPREWHPRTASEETRIFDMLGNGISTTTTYEYEGDLNSWETPLLMKKNSQYAFVPVGSGLPATPVRTSETKFLQYDENYPQWVKDIYKNQNMVGLAISTTIRDGAGMIVSRSEMKYDDGDYSPNIGRGNPTTSRVWDSTKGSWDNPNAYIQTRARFDSYGNQYEAIDAQGNSTTTIFDSVYHAFPIQVTSAVPDPSGQQGSSTPFVSTATFDPTTGLPLTTTDANGLETRINYDPVTLRPLNTKTFYNGNQIGGMSEIIYHDEPNNYWVKSRTQIETDKWAESISYFDGLGRAYKAEEVNSEGNIFVEKEFDEDGRVKRVTNPFRAGEAKQWTTNVYDEASRVKEVILPDGAKVKTDWGVLVSDIVGVTKQITDQAGKKRKGISDALGRMIRVVEDPDGQNLATDYVFDTLGNLRQTVQGVQSRYFTYDSLGRLRYAKQPEQEANTGFVFADAITGNAQWSVKYDYDDNGNITKTTDARGVSVTGSYDALNRLKLRDYSDATPDVRFFYDGKYLDINNAPQTATGSIKGKTTSVKSTVSQNNYTSFDNLGRLLASQQITDGKTYNFGYQYNLTALVSETYPSGRKVSFDFDQNGDVASVWGAANGQNRVYANGIHYNSAGAIERLRLGNGKWETAVYNNRQQITEIGLGSSADDKSLLKLEYGYGTAAQNNGSLRSQKISFSGLAQAFEQTYAYDDLNRLLSAEEKVNNSTTWKQTFSYDRYGNRRFDAANTTTLTSQNNLTNPQIDQATNRFSAGQNYAYDKTGSVTLDAENKRFVYDAENRLKEFFAPANNTTTPDATYHYDGNGKRVKKISSTETTVFVYDGSGQLAAEYSTQLAPTPQVSYLTTDHLGSPRIITNAAGKVIARHDFSAFGDETYTPQRTDALGYKPDTIRQDYTGYQKDDESGLEFAQARYYNTAHGRFTSTDPLTASASIRDPQTFNRYSYAMNSPYKFTDPLGLIASSAGSNDEARSYARQCDLTCRAESGSVSKDDIELLQWHVANGTALGYIWQNTLEKQQTSGLSENSSGNGTFETQDDSVSDAGNRTVPLVWNGEITGFGQLESDVAGFLEDAAQEFQNLDEQLKSQKSSIDTALSDLRRLDGFTTTVAPQSDGKILATLTNPDGKTYHIAGDAGINFGSSITKNIKLTNMLDLVGAYNGLIQKRNDRYTELKTKFQNDYNGRFITINSASYTDGRKSRVNTAKLGRKIERKFLGDLFTMRIGRIAGQN